MKKRKKKKKKKNKKKRKKRKKKEKQGSPRTSNSSWLRRQRPKRGGMQEPTIPRARERALNKPEIEKQVRRQQLAHLLPVRVAVRTIF